MKITRRTPLDILIRLCMTKFAQFVERGTILAARMNYPSAPVPKKPDYSGSVK